MVSSDCALAYESKAVTVSSSGSYLELPATWNAGQLAVAEATLSLPTGTLEAVSLTLGKLSAFWESWRHSLARTYQLDSSNVSEPLLLFELAYDIGKLISSHAWVQIFY